MQRVYFDGLHQLDCRGTQVPFNIFTPQILDDSGAKLSKTIYLTQGAYADVPPAWTSMQAFQDRFGTAGLDMLWDEISGWVRSPEKFFRNYTVRYLEYAFGQLSDRPVRRHSLVRVSVRATRGAAREHAHRSPPAGHSAATLLARGWPAAMHPRRVPAAHRQDNVLLALRQGTGFADGMWNLPSGKAETAETAVAAVIREAHEELGIRLSEPRDQLRRHRALP